MSTLFYGAPPGAALGSSGSSANGGVLLTRCQLLDCERRVMTNGPDYLGTVHRLTVRGLYNPEVNAYDFFNARPSAAAPAPNLAGLFVNAAGGGFTRDQGLLAVLNAAGNPAGVVAGAVGQSRGAFGPTTDVAIRHVLMQPRRQLVWAVGNVPVLVSPGLNSDGTAASTDMYNGPVPLGVPVVRAVGTKTFQVEFSVETYLNESNLFASPASVLLSHRYRQYEDIDQDMYSTVVTEGVAVFRTDRLAFLGMLPDDFREYLFHPVRPGFARRNWHVEVSEDLSQLRYVLVDRHTHLLVTLPGVTRVECFETIEGIDSNVMAASAAAGRGVVGVVQKDYSAVRAAVIDMLGHAVPLINLSVVARVWGNDQTKRKQLQRMAMRLIGRRIQVAYAASDVVGRSFAGTRFSMSHDVNGSFVEGVFSALMPNVNDPGTRSISFAVPEIKVINVESMYPDTDETDGCLATSLNPALDLPFRKNIDGTGTRAGTIRRLAVAALVGPNATPPGPPIQSPFAQIGKPP